MREREVFSELGSGPKNFKIVYKLNEDRVSCANKVIALYTGRNIK